jgi:hypothetical protein
MLFHPPKSPSDVRGFCSTFEWSEKKVSLTKIVALLNSNFLPRSLDHGEKGHERFFDGHWLQKREAVAEGHRLSAGARS